MADLTDQVVASTTPAIPPPAAASLHEFITPQQAADRESRVAASARKATEKEWQEKFDAEVASRDARLAEFEKAEADRKAADMTELDKLKQERDTLAEQARVSAQMAQSVTEQLTGAQKRTQVSMMIAASAQRVPPRYHADVYAELSQAEEIIQDLVDAALAKAKATWEADLTTYGPQQPPVVPTTPRNVGSATAPPSSQPQTPQSDEERRAHIADLFTRANAGDPEAGKALDAIYGQRKPGL